MPLRLLRVQEWLAISLIIGFKCPLPSAELYYCRVKQHCEYLQWSWFKLWLFIVSVQNCLSERLYPSFNDFIFGHGVILGYILLNYINLCCLTCLCFFVLCTFWRHAILWLVKYNSGCVWVLESPGILLWHFSGLESPRK